MNNNSNDNEEIKNSAQEENIANEKEVNEINLQKELEKQKEYYLRIVADCEDRMRRSKQDAIHSINVAIENIARDLLPFVYDIDKAIEIAEEKTKDGLKLMHKNLLNMLKKYGIEEIEAKVGQDFDSNFHHAVSSKEQDGMEEGKIINIIQTGYKINNKPINATMVIISK